MSGEVSSKARGLPEPLALGGSTLLTESAATDFWDGFPPFFLGTALWGCTLGVFPLVADLLGRALPVLGMF